MKDYQCLDLFDKLIWLWFVLEIVLVIEMIVFDWWKVFGDIYFDGLIDKVIVGNFDVKILVVCIEVVFVGIEEVWVGVLLMFDLGVGVNFEKSIGWLFMKQFNVVIQVNWEIDIWGKVEKGVQVQIVVYCVLEVDWCVGYLMLVFGVLMIYFQILQFDEQFEQ